MITAALLSNTCEKSNSNTLNRCDLRGLKVV